MEGRFWGGASDEEGSESERSEEQNEESSEESWEISDSDSHSEEEVRAPIKDTRTKTYERMESAIANLINHMKINDWNAIYDDFTELIDWYKQSQTIVRQDGTPRQFLENFVNLEELIRDLPKDKKDSMNKTNSKSYNAMKQRVKKQRQEMQTELEKYKENPEAFPDPMAKREQGVEEPTPGKDDPNDEGWQVVGKTRKGIETEEDFNKRLTEILRKRGLKKTVNRHLLDELRELLSKAKTDLKKIEVYMVQISIMFDDTHPDKGMRRDAWCETWKALLRVLRLLSSNAAIMKELTASPADSDFNATAVLNNLSSFIHRLDEEFKKSLLHLDPHTHEYIERLRDESLLLDLAARAQDYYERVNNKHQAARMAAVRVEHLYYKLDSVAEKIETAHIEREVKKSQEGKKPEESSSTVEQKSAVEQQPQPPAADSASTSTTNGPAAAADKTAKPEDSQKVVKPSADQPPKEKTAEELLEEEEEPKVLEDRKAEDPSKQIEQLCHILIYHYGDDRLKTRAMLCSVYHHALCDRYYQARDIILMSHIQDNIQHMDASTHVMYNRTMAQIGLCAFRKGLIAEAHACLAELCSGGRTRELLAQGIRYQYEKNPEIEKQEKRRQVPYHMQINQDLLETVHLVSAMLLEVPNMAAHPYEVKPKIISRTFHSLLKYFSMQVFTGPPENTRDFVATAARALASGDWKRCEELLLHLPVWELTHNSDQVKAMLRRKIQEEGLRTYLFTYSPHYDSMSIDSLATLFELPSNAVFSLVSKMIINDELHASLDQPTSTVVMHRVEPTRLQYLALQYAEKVSLFVETNERTLDSITGGYGYKWTDQKQTKEGWRRSERGDQPSAAASAYPGTASGADGQERRRSHRRNAAPREGGTSGGARRSGQSGRSRRTSSRKDASSSGRWETSSGGNQRRRPTRGGSSSGWTKG